MNRFLLSGGPPLCCLCQAGCPISRRVPRPCAFCEGGYVAPQTGWRVAHPLRFVQRAGGPSFAVCAKGGIPQSEHEEILTLIFAPPAPCPRNAGTDAGNAA